jgi:transcriptional regulator with XRE-family HTH domain
VVEVLTMNMRLKVALVQSGEPQYAVARRAEMSETRLSRILLERATATDDEREAIARALGTDAELLFPAK